MSQKKKVLMMKKPVIGITCAMEYDDENRDYPVRFAFDFLKRQYYQAIEMAGGMPILLPNIENLELIDELIQILNGLLVSGGWDIDPSFFGQEFHPKSQKIRKERDFFEISLVRKARQNKIPILGICRGLQLINVAFGGTLYQDLSLVDRGVLQYASIYDHSNQGKFDYKKKHLVEIKEKTKLFSIIKQKTIEVNTSHHQVIKDLAPGFLISALAEDKVIEGIESEKDDYLVGIQWHPEVAYENKISRAIFESLVEAAKR
jgi:putative glutamine amidotransferase